MEEKQERVMNIITASLSDDTSLVDLLEEFGTFQTSMISGWPGKHGFAGDRLSWMRKNYAEDKIKAGTYKIGFVESMSDTSNWKVAHPVLIAKGFFKNPNWLGEGVNSGSIVTSIKNLYLSYGYFSGLYIDSYDFAAGDLIAVCKEISPDEVKATQSRLREEVSESEQESDDVNEAFQHGCLSMIGIIIFIFFIVILRSTS